MRTTNVCAVIASLLSGLGCQGQETIKDDEQVAEKPSAKPEATLAEQTKPAQPDPVKTLEGDALANHYVGCWNFYNQKEWEQFGQCYDEKATSRSPDSGRPELSGRQAIVDESAKSFATAFADVKGAPEIVLVNGRELATVALVTGTHSAPLQTADGSTIPATNKTIGQHVFHAVTFDAENQITRETFVQDNATFLSQLGLSDHPGRAPEVAALAGSPNIVVSKHDATEQTNIDLVKKTWQDFQKEDLKALEAVLADDIVEADQAAQENLSGKKAVLDSAKTFFAAMGDIQLDCPSVWGAGAYVVSQCTLRATNDGNMGKRFKKTGKSVELTVVEVTKVEAGKIQEQWRFLDGQAFAQQLGLAPPPKVAEAAAPAPAAAQPGSAPADKPASAPPKDQPAAGHK